MSINTGSVNAGSVDNFTDGNDPYNLNIKQNQPRNSISFQKPTRKLAAATISEAPWTSHRLYEPPPLNAKQGKTRSQMHIRYPESSLGRRSQKRPPSKWIKNIGFGWDLLEEEKKNREPVTVNIETASERARREREERRKREEAAGIPNMINGVQAPSKQYLR